MVFCYVGTKLLLTPIKLGFWPKTAKFGPKYAIFGHFRPNIAIFAHFVQCPTKNNVNKVPRWVFRYVGNKTFDFSSKKKDFLPKNDQIWPKIGIFGQFGPGHACRLIWCPVGGSVGGCGARAVSRKTPLYFVAVNDFFGEASALPNFMNHFEYEK